MTAANPKSREAQRVLAQEVTTWVHGADALEQAQAATAALWGRGELSELSEQTLAAATASLPTTDLVVGESTIVDLLVGAGLERGRNAARKTVAAGGAYLNNVKVTDEDRPVDVGDLLAGGMILVRKGWRNLAVARRS